MNESKVMKTKTPRRKRYAFFAWAASLPLALAIPAVIWMLTVSFDGRQNWEFYMIIIGVSMAVHLLSYLVTGLPLFLFHFKKPQSRIWLLPVALPLGVLLGCIGPLCIELRTNEPVIDYLPIYLICGGYGLATALAAWLQRPTRTST